jgi:hypothetical protein
MPYRSPDIGKAASIAVYHQAFLPETISGRQMTCGPQHLLQLEQALHQPS